MHACCFPSVWGHSKKERVQTAQMGRVPISVVRLFSAAHTTELKTRENSMNAMEIS
jgi:hypothetical protein